MFWRRRRFTDFAAEVESHIAMEADRLRRQGMSEAEARAAAMREFGNMTASEERFFESGSGSAVMETVVRDLRYGLRVLAKNPAFTVVAVLSLALGIGANTAIFQLVDAVRLRSLPVRNPAELLQVRVEDMSKARGNMSGLGTLTFPLWEQIRTRQQAFSEIGDWAPAGFDLATSGEPRPVNGLFAGGGLFQTLGIEPVLGRLFTPADDQPGCGFPGAVISYGFWQSHFGGAAAAVGSTLTLSSHPVAVIGITPPSFYGLEVGQTFDVALPVCSQGALQHIDLKSTGTTWWLVAIGRLKPGWSMERAQAYFLAIAPAAAAASLPPDYPPVSIKGYLAIKLLAEPARAGLSRLREGYSTPLWMLLGIAGLVLSIACANLANLMLARASAREREITVRLAIGASRGRLVRQLMTESLMVALAGAGLGLLMARQLSGLLVSLLTTERDKIFLDLALDWRVMGFTAGLGILTALLFGLAPALRSTRQGLGEVLKSAGRGSSSARESFGLRRILVISQVALSLVLVAGALLFIDTFRNLANADTGFRQRGVLVAQVGFGRLKIPQERVLPFKKELVTRLRALPGVDSAAEADMVPLGGSYTSNQIWMDGADPNHGTRCMRASVGEGYFETMGMPLLAGRAFDAHDTVGSQKVAVVNEEFARQLTHGGNPIGKHFWVEQTPNTPSTEYEIVGLVRNTKYQRLREDSEAIAFQAVSQDPNTSAGDEFLIHSTLPMNTLIAEVRQMLTGMGPGMRYAFQVFQTQIQNTLMQERLMATLSSAFGILAGLLAAIGLYGVMTYLVARRRNEIGIRMALGANRTQIMKLVLRESGMLLGAGVAAGTVLTLAATQAVRSLLWGVEPSDARTLVVACAVLAAVGLAASVLPARRAAKVDPMTALRDE